MKTKRLIFYFAITIIISCDPEPAGPESNCTLQPLYKLNHHFIAAGKVFDIRTDPPKEIKNGKIEYGLNLQFIFSQINKPFTYPYTEYFVDSIEFSNPNWALVKIFESDNFRTYEYFRIDCQIELESSEGNMLLELTKSGEEISEKRFAIYDYKRNKHNQDSFSFIEFRLGSFASYEDIIRKFAKDNSGKYDTIAIEMVQNRTIE